MPYPLTNVLIDALPEASRHRLMLQLKPVDMALKERLYDAEEAPRFVHFVTSGIASIGTTMLDGGTTEVATVGREGVPQGLHLRGPAPVPTRCFMQISGTALRMEMEAFERLYAEDEAIRRIVTAYSQYQCLMISQIAGCNRLHGVESRMARWMLVVEDRTGEEVLRLTQEFLAQMIGSRRTTVTEVAGKLHDRGLIDYARGTVRILNREGLERVACECYPISRGLLKSLYKPAGQTVFGDEPLQ